MKKAILWLYNIAKIVNRSSFILRLNEKDKLLIFTQKKLNTLKDGIIAVCFLWFYKYTAIEIIYKKDVHFIPRAAYKDIS